MKARDIQDHVLKSCGCKVCLVSAGRVSSDADYMPFVPFHLLNIGLDHLRLDKTVDIVAM